MDIIIYVNEIFEHQKEWLGAFVDGLKVHGIVARIRTVDAPDYSADLAVMWSFGPKWKLTRAGLEKKGIDYLVLDRGYIGEKDGSASISLNGLHGLSKLQVIDCPGDRADGFKNLYKKWNPSKKKYVLIMGQLAGDASLQGINIRSWMVRKIRELKAAGYEVIYRSHPRDNQHISYGVPFMKATLEECLKIAKCVYTYSSTSGVDAMLAGKPVIAESPVSMVYDLAGHNVKDIKKLKEPASRKQWFNDLAYRQWKLEEIRSGEAWEYIKSRINA